MLNRFGRTIAFRLLIMLSQPENKLFGKPSQERPTIVSML